MKSGFERGPTGQVAAEVSEAALPVSANGQRISVGRIWLEAHLSGMASELALAILRMESQQVQVPAAAQRTICRRASPGCVH